MSMSVWVFLDFVGKGGEEASASVILFVDVEATLFCV